MVKHLFLEGPVQTGKSTLIRRALGDRLAQCGGFTSQRLLDAGGRTRGFRIGPAPSTALTAPLDGGSREGIFKLFGPEGTVSTDQSVFHELGPKLLVPPEGCPLMILDEIGGSELLSRPFRRALDALLSGGVPCLGVIKTADSARRMQRQYGGEEILERNLLLRGRILEEPDGRLLYYERGVKDLEAAANRALEEFLGDIFV